MGFRSNNRWCSDNNIATDQCGSAARVFTRPTPNMGRYKRQASTGNSHLSPIMSTTYSTIQRAEKFADEPSSISDRLCALNALYPRPIANSYWATPWLVACEYPWCPGTAAIRQKIDALLAAGVRTFIDLTEADELRPYCSYLNKRAEALNLEDIEYHRFPIQDRSLPASIAFMRDIIEVLRDNENRGRISAVHCR